VPRRRPRTKRNPGDPQAAQWASEDQYGIRGTERRAEASWDALYGPLFRLDMGDVCVWRCAEKPGAVYALTAEGDCYAPSSVEDWFRESVGGGVPCEVSRYAVTAEMVADTREHTRSVRPSAVLQAYAGNVDNIDPSSTRSFPSARAAVAFIRSVTATARRRTGRRVSGRR
jgi:hypothetical protein